MAEVFCGPKFQIPNMHWWHNTTIFLWHKMQMPFCIDLNETKLFNLSTFGEWFVWRTVWCITSLNVQEHHPADQCSVKLPDCLLAPLWPIGSLFIGYHVGPWLPLLVTLCFPCSLWTPSGWFPGSSLYYWWKLQVFVAQLH